MKKETKRNIIIAVVLVLLLVVFFKGRIIGEAEGGTRIEVKFYDKDYNVIYTTRAPSFAIVQDIPNVFHATFTVLAENTGDQTLTMWISGARQCNTADTTCMNLIGANSFLTSGTLWDAFAYICAGPLCTEQAAIGDTVSFGESDYISFEGAGLEGTEQRYAVQVIGSYELPGTPYIEVKEKTWVDLTIKPDPGGAGFIVDLYTSASGGLAPCIGEVCSDHCGVIADGEIATSKYYQGFCDIFAEECVYSVRARAIECGGEDLCSPGGVPKDCGSKCIGTTLWYAGYCDVDTGDCVWQTDSNNAICGGTGT